MVENSLYTKAEIYGTRADADVPAIELVPGSVLSVTSEINPCPPNTGFCQPQIMCIPQTEGCLPTNPGQCVPQITCGPNIGCFPTPPR